MSDSVVRSADECVRALEKALVAMDTALEVYEGILRIIAAFVPYRGEANETNFFGCYENKQTTCVFPGVLRSGSPLGWGDLSSFGLMFAVKAKRNVKLTDIEFMDMELDCLRIYTIYIRPGGYAKEENGWTGERARRQCKSLCSLFDYV